MGFFGREADGLVDVGEGGRDFAELQSSFSAVLIGLQKRGLS